MVTAVVLDEFMDDGDPGLEVTLLSQFEDMPFDHIVIFLCAGNIQLYSMKYYDKPTKGWNQDDHHKSYSREYKDFSGVHARANKNFASALLPYGLKIIRSSAELEF